MSTDSRERWARASFMEPAVATAKPSSLAISASPDTKSASSSMSSARSMSKAYPSGRQARKVCSIELWYRTVKRSRAEPGHRPVGSPKWYWDCKNRLARVTRRVFAVTVCRQGPSHCSHLPRAPPWHTSCLSDLPSFVRPRGRVRMDGLHSKCLGEVRSGDHVPALRRPPARRSQEDGTCFGPSQLCSSCSGCWA